MPEWLTVRSIDNQALLKALSAQLDPGESAAIALSMELVDAVVIVDDRKARCIARQLDVPLVGTVGLLLRAKRESLVPEVKTVLDELEKAGFRLSRELRREALRLAGEGPGPHELG